MNQLKALFPACTQQDVQPHGMFLYEVHSSYIRDRGDDMVAIRSVLDLPNEEPEAEDAISVASPLADNVIRVGTSR